MKRHLATLPHVTWSAAISSASQPRAKFEITRLMGTEVRTIFWSVSCEKDSTWKWRCTPGRGLLRNTTSGALALPWASSMILIMLFGKCNNPMTGHNYILFFVLEIIIWDSVIPRHMVNQCNTCLLPVLCLTDPFIIIIIIILESVHIWDSMISRHMVNHSSISVSDKSSSFQTHDVPSSQGLA